MSKKRKIETKSSGSSSVEVINENLVSNPFCLHGPTLLFSNEKIRFYACSLSRNKRDCTVHILHNDWSSIKVKKINEKYKCLIQRLNKISLKHILDKIKNEPANNRSYCLSCNELYCRSATKKHGEHRTKTSITDMELTHPSTWLPALENDSVEAQYLFSPGAIDVIVDILIKNRISKTICIGTPSVHEAVNQRQDFSSILLDFDKRHAQFHFPEKFIWYNMFNNFMFNGKDDEKLLKEFLKGDRPCIIIDPPFGGRVEPLVKTLQDLSSSYSSINSEKQKLLPIIWAFPYFSEPYITNMLPELKMHDYQVEYENHKKFHSKNSRARKFGSPVRLFTNLPFSTIDLSQNPKYKFCSVCNIWVAITNNHCFKCGRCSSKNGMSYQHCEICNRCVKPTFFHCERCKRCCQVKDHVCGVVLQAQSCYNCHEKGHKKSDCPKLKNAYSKKKRK